MARDNNVVPILCGTNSLYIPTKGCTECDRIYERLDALEACCADVEEILSNKITFVHTNIGGASKTVEVIGTAVE